MRRSAILLSGTLLFLAISDLACGQTQIRQTVPPTQISFEILLPERRTGLNAQRWGAVFQQLGESARFRQPLLNDKPEIKEVRSGRTRIVTAIGDLQPDGSIAFPDHRFRLSDTRKLAEWVRELKTYGAQGSPDGRSNFGLSPSQLDQVMRTLETPVAAELSELPIDQALRQFILPETLPLRLSIEAETRLSKLPDAVVAPSDLLGLSRGTALAILLSRAHLGFRPGRTPSGSLELLAVPLVEDTGLWPIGWPLDLPPVRVAPKYVQLVLFDLNEKPLTELLDQAKRDTDLRFLVDVRRIAEREVSVDGMKVTQPRKLMTWSGLLDRATFPDLMPELLQDEAGRPFVWLTTRTTAQLNERAKQRESRLKIKQP
ncbi:hypothetical protein GC176_19570 [bacterium]|nr:hypothetical protein [bacterium]